MFTGIKPGQAYNKDLWERAKALFEEGNLTNGQIAEKLMISIWTVRRWKAKWLMLHTVEIAPRGGFCRSKLDQDQEQCVVQMQTEQPTATALEIIRQLKEDHIVNPDLNVSESCIGWIRKKHELTFKRIGGVPLERIDNPVIQAERTKWLDMQESFFGRPDLLFQSIF